MKILAVRASCLIHSYIPIWCTGGLSSSSTVSPSVYVSSFVDLETFSMNDLPFCVAITSVLSVPYPHEVKNRKLSVVLCALVENNVSKNLNCVPAINAKEQTTMEIYLCGVTEIDTSTTSKILER